MSDALLRVEGLCVERGARLLFERLCLVLRAGEILQVVGPNGAGKSSLLRVLAGVLEPLAGRLYWRGERARAAEYNDELLYIGHKPAVREGLTALENLRWYAHLHSVAGADSGLRRLLRAVGLAGYECELGARLSAGQCRRLALARLGLGVPAPLWILDEPFTALDAAGVATVSGWIARRAEEGGAVVLATHQAAQFGRAAVRRLEVGSGGLGERGD